MSDSTTKAAIITTTGAIVAAIIMGTCGYLSRPSEKVAEGGSTPAPQAAPQPSSTTSLVNKSNESQVDTLPPRKMYEVVTNVGEQKAYVDPETGFVFTVEEITDWLGTRGVLSYYTLPNGTSPEMRRWWLGYRVDFHYQGRKFFMVIEDINYKEKFAKIRIKEILG